MFLKTPQIAFLICCLIQSCAVFAEDAAEYEDSTFRFQSTYIWERKAAFDAPYADGRNSLSSGLARSYTATETGYWGFRPWKGGELYFNPEITQGVPFSGLAGAGAFTNGELTRSAGTKPHLSIGSVYFFVKRLV